MYERPEPARLEALLDDVRAGRRSALEALLRATHAELVRAIRGMNAAVFAQYDPEDVWQEASLEALRSQHQMRASTLPAFRGWFLGIARHCVAKLHRGQRARVRPRRSTTLPVSQLSLFGAERMEEHESLVQEPTPTPTWSRLDPLRQEQRAAVVLHDVFGTGWDTLALILGRGTTSAARALHHRARTSLGEATLP